MYTQVLMFASAVLMTLALATGWLDADVREAQRAEIVGLYRCMGEGPQGPYEATVEIKPQGETYRLMWKFADGGVLPGVALWEGNRLTVAYWHPQDLGVAVYRLNRSRLVGRWTAASSEGIVYTETLTRVITGEGVQR